MTPIQSQWKRIVDALTGLSVDPIDVHGGGYMLSDGDAGRLAGVVLAASILAADADAQAIAKLKAQVRDQQVMISTLRGLLFTAWTLTTSGLGEDPDDD